MCENCQLKIGDDNLTIFHFHHIDPETKSFKLSDVQMRKECSQMQFEEADKCQLLCANCHLLEHSIPY